AYGGTSWGALGLTGGAAYGQANIDTSRAPSLGDAAERLKGSTDGRIGQIFSELNYSMSFEHMQLQPYARLSYVSFDSDDYRETGGAAALGVKGGQSNTTYSTIGLRLSPPSIWAKGGRRVLPAVSD
ncbi:autotransporter domain-containing protein, partial [Thioclava sp. BHET1]